MTRYVTFEVDTALGPARRVGVVLGDEFLDLHAAYTAILRDRMDATRVPAVAAAVLPPDLQAVLGNGRLADEAIAEVVDRFGARTDLVALTDEVGARLGYRSDEVRILAPLPRPPSLRDSSIFEEHFRKAFPQQQVPDAWYDLPVYYKGNPAAVVGTGAEVAMPSFARKLDYEVEFAVVVGRRGRDLTEAEALDHVAGYMVYNDLTARGMQMKEMQMFLGPAKGKDFDAGNVLGPYLVTPDEFDPAAANAMIARVNGEEWSRGQSDTAHHPVARLLSHISRCETLHVGDVIGSGTVGNGSGAELGRFLEAGDVVEIEIEGLGVVSNRLVAATSTAGDDA